MQGEQPVATHEIPGTSESQNECFPSTLDPSKQPCARPQIEGRLIAIQERMQEGERTAVVLLQSGTALVEVQLPGQYYRSLVRDFSMRNDVLNRLTYRIDHLPKPPQMRTDQEEVRLCYAGNAYTLAVLEPDMLLNITDLNQAEYCARQYLLRRLSPSGSSP